MKQIRCRLCNERHSLSKPCRSLSRTLDSVTEIDISHLRRDGGTQPRAEIDQQIVADYAEAMQAGVKFPPVIVFYDGSDYWLADGFHRAAAAEQAQLAEVAADVRQGTKRDALLYSVSANATHGLRRTNADKRRAVLLVLSDSEWFETMSDRKIAEHVGVSQPFVSALRAELVKTRTTDNRYQSEAEDEAEPEAEEPPEEESGDDGSGAEGEAQTEDESAEATERVRYVTLAEWRAMDAIGREAILDSGDKSNTSINTQQNTSIEWARQSWNPVTGCLHNCSYCYARDIANRFFAPKFAPVLWPDRLWAPANVKVPVEASAQIGHKNIFTCSMADLFGRWVPAEWIQAVLDVVSGNPQWNFLFLTKFPGRLAEFTFPENAWIGATVDAQARVPFVEKAFAQVTASVKWLSCEPLLEPLWFERLDLFQWVVIGGASGSTETPDFQPPRHWVDQLERQARSAGCRVYEKTNLLDRIREYPGGPASATVDVPAEFKMGYLQRDLHDWQTYEKETYEKEVVSA